MTAVQIRSLLRTLVYITVVAVPLFFWRSVADAFDLIKGTTLGFISLFTLGALILLALVDRKQMASKPIWIATGIFTGAAIIATVTSMDPVQSIVGQYQRYTGLVTLIGGVLVVLAIAAAFSERQIITLGQVMVATAGAVVFYTFLQESENDPFLWTSESFGKFVFGTLGNPNTGAGFTAVSLPLAAWSMLRNQHSSYVRALSGLVFGGILGAQAAYNSFQGPVAATATIIYLVAWAWWNGRTLGTWLIAGFGALAIPVITTRVGLTWTTWLLIGTAVAFALVGWYSPSIVRVKLPETLYRIRWVLAGMSGLVILAGAMLLGPRVVRLLQSEVSDGMVERGDFWRTGVAIWQENPIFGSGIETFGHLFTAYRPENHAVNLESSRTSSVHSVHLGMFSNGGLILGVAYLAFIGIVLWALWRGLRADRHKASGLLLAAGAAFIAAQLQSSVSVEHVALNTLHFTLAGIVLALGAPIPPRVLAEGETPVKRRKARRLPTVPTGLVASIMVMALLLNVFVVLRPVRAAMASFTGVRAATQLQDIAGGIKDLSDAVSRAPWEGLYWVQRAEMKAFAGDTAGAAADASEAASRLRYKPGSTGALANIIMNHADQLVANGDAAGATSEYLRAIEVAERGAENDPLAIGVQNASAGVYVRAARALFNIGETETATDSIEDALNLVAEFGPALELKAELGL
jgi:O-antigen ligase